MQQHEQPLAPTAVDHAGAGVGRSSLDEQGPLSAGTANTGSSVAPPASNTVANEPIPRTMGAKDAKSLHKHLEKEAKAEDSNIKHQIKDIGKVSMILYSFHM